MYEDVAVYGGVVVYIGQTHKRLCPGSNGGTGS